MWWGCVQAIADVHALDWRRLNLDKLLMPEPGEHPLEQMVELLLRHAAVGIVGTAAPELVDCRGVVAGQHL